MTTPAFERDQQYLGSLSDGYITEVIDTNVREAQSPDNDKHWIHEARLDVFVPEALRRGIALPALRQTVEVS